MGGHYPVRQSCPNRRRGLPNSFLTAPRVSAQQKKPEREDLPPFLAIMSNNVSKPYQASDVGVSS